MDNDFPLTDLDGSTADTAGSGDLAHGARASRDFAHALLAALTEMAVLSPRRQADVTVAIRRAGLSASADAISRAIDQLRQDGCVEPPLVLSDGGILISVTMRGIETLSNTAHRHVVTRLMREGRR